MLCSAEDLHPRAPIKNKEFRTVGRPQESEMGWGAGGGVYRLRGWEVEVSRVEELSLWGVEGLRG